MNTAIIVAAGTGSRFGGETPKQFLEIGGKPLLVHAIERFEESVEIKAVVVVLSHDRVTEYSEYLRGLGFSKLRAVVAGGRTRAESVHNGLHAIEWNCPVVAVHDGARPVVTADEIDRSVKAAEAHGAACLTAPVTDTIKEISDGMIERTIDRNILRRALTPQTFRKEILEMAFSGIDLSEAVTDECYLVEQIGIEIAVVDGSARNIKVTSPDDLRIAELFLTSS